MKKLVVSTGGIVSPDHPADTLVIRPEDIKLWIKSGEYLRRLFSFDEVTLLTYRSATLSRPFLTMMSLRLLCRGKIHIHARDAQPREISIANLAGLLVGLIKDWSSKRALLQRVEEQVEDEAGMLRTARHRFLSQPENSPLYCRTDLVFGLRAGGSVGHIAGVLNNLPLVCGQPTFFTTGSIPTVDDTIAEILLEPTSRFWDFPELSAIASNFTFEQQILSALGDAAPSFIYQRYCLNNYIGVSLARRFTVPFVLEFNGPEVWVARNWGSPLKYEALSAKIELLNLKAADVVVVVSQPLKDELVARDIDADKILVNPNGVNPERYSPAIDGSPVRRQYGLEDKVVIGFIGTFGLWHGAEVLAEAFGRLLHDNSVCREQLVLMMIGDGIAMPEVRANIARYGIEAQCILSGTVPQEDGPGYLAACDILVSPHVPNADGTPFFGSPTKLFEYMAMGKAIVASQLDQIAEVLEHEHSAWMVKPGDAEALADAICHLAAQPELRKRLGRAAREAAVEKYTWLQHTHRIINKMQQRCGEQNS